MNIDYKELMDSINEFGDKRYKAGLADGLSVVEKINGWLPNASDAEKQQLQRECEEAIREIREKNGL